MIADIVKDLRSQMSESIESLKRDLGKRRTGRANVAMLDGIKVDYYGTLSPLNQVAALAVPDPRMITIKPWEKSMVTTIERAIQQSPLGLNPSSDGELIRIPIPPLTTERRRDLIKDIKRIAEESKVALRNHRRDANDMVKTLEKEKEISEDEMRRGLTQVQDVLKEFEGKVDELIGAKEKEILED